MPRENVSSSSSTDLEMAASEASAESGRDGREKKVEMGKNKNKADILWVKRTMAKSYVLFFLE